MKRLSVLAAVVLVGLMVHAWGGSATRVSPLASCEPDCTGVADKGLVADPINCTNYYVCQSGMPYGPLNCGSSNIFNPETGACGVGDTCEAICGGGANCPLTCNGTVDAIGDVFDCSTYYYCTPSGPSDPHYCVAPLPYYDGNANQCSADESVCCTGYCTPYCTSGDYSFVPDPTSCTDFYVCPEEGDVDESNKLSCNSGQVFDVATGSCVAGDPTNCQTLCDAAPGGGDGGTTIIIVTPPASSGDTTPTITTTGSGRSTDSNGCITSLVCTAAGNFAACNTCQPYYYICSGAGASGELDRCPEGYFFNPSPGNPICVLEGNCPYP